MLTKKTTAKRSYKTRILTTKKNIAAIFHIETSALAHETLKRGIAA